MDKHGIRQESPSQSTMRDLQQQILQYNNNCRNAAYHLKMEKVGSYTGMLDILYGDAAHQITVNSTATCADIIQTLVHLLHPNLQWHGDTAKHCCLTLRQGEVQRELGINERPLEIALDCCTQGTATPAFCLKTNRLGTSDLKLQVFPAEQSNGSVKLQKTAPHPLCNKTSISPVEDSTTAVSSPTTRHKQPQGKWGVSDIFTRSLRVRKKAKTHTSLLPSNKHQTFSLISPILSEKQFTMSTVMHIYYKNNSSEQYCKGVLVSEKSHTKEVIVQALERYDLKFCDPQHFGLHEVIGKWEEVGSDEGQCNEKRHFADVKFSMLKSSKKQVTEEFVVCFERELQSSECPYNSQFYFEASKGYSRRFELRRRELTDVKNTQTSAAPKKTKATARTTNELLSVPSHGMYSAQLDTAFVLFLRVYDHKREFLAHKLLSEQTYFVNAAGLNNCNTNVSVSSKGSESAVSEQEQRISNIGLFSPEFSQETSAICVIKKRTLNGCVTVEDNCLYSIDAIRHDYQISVNGTVIEKPTPLQYGDLVSVGQSYVFVFYDDYHAVTDHPPSRYTWEKKVFLDGAATVNGATAMQHCSTPKPHTTVHQHTDFPFTCEETSPIAVHQTAPHLDCGNEGFDIVNPASGDMCSATLATWNNTCDGFGCSSEDLSSSTGTLGSLHVTNTGPPNQTHEDQFLSAHGLLFNNEAKEDLVITCVTERFNVASSKMNLLPAYILTMCINYQLRTHGMAAAALSINKASQGLQLVLWSSILKLMDQKFELHNEESQTKTMDEILQHLKPIFFWLSNTMEFYNFLTECAVTSKSTVGSDENSALCNLHQILVYAFQQAFYTLSKVLYHTLPSMISNFPLDCASGHKILIGPVVDFLQAILDLLNDLNVHIEVIFQLFSNLFFFINAAMFNYLVIYGKELRVFRYHCGKSLRVNMDLLEGWACQQGFKSIVLNYMVKLSSLVDLLCIPFEELMQMDWTTLRQEFPVLSAAQLHFILSSYDVGSEGSPLMWLPSTEDAECTLDCNAVNESFDNGPEFFIPSLGYHLDHTQPAPEALSYMETFHQLSSSKKSVDVMPLIEDHPSLKMPDLITKLGDSEMKVSKQPSCTGSKYSNIVRQNTEHQQMHELTGQTACATKLNSLKSSQNPEHISYDKWILSHFPLGSRVVTVPRGDKGFGVIIVEGKDNATDDSAIFVQTVLPGSTASQTNQLAPGDRILAIDGQKLDGADYFIAQKYLNEAEEEVVLVLATKN